MKDIKEIIMRLAEHLQVSLNQTGTTVSHHRSGLVQEPNCTALTHYCDFLLILWYLESFLKSLAAEIK